MPVATLRKLQKKGAVTRLMRPRYSQCPITVQASADRVLSSNAEAPKVIATITNSKQKMAFTVVFLTYKILTANTPKQLMLLR